MNENPSRVRIPKWIRMIVPPLIAATVVLTAACSGDDDAQQYQSQASSQAQQQQQEAAYAAAQQQDEQQQQAMQQEQEEASAQQAEQQQSAAAAAPTSRRGSRYRLNNRSKPSKQWQTRPNRKLSSPRLLRAAPESAASQRTTTTATLSARLDQLRGLRHTGWRETADDDTSTFSLDVDRTSYFLALNWVDAGYAIEPASVRAEEWTNAFNYNYELPRVDDSFAVTTDIVEHPLHSDLHLVRIATQAPEFVDNTPLNVTLVLDASGSMREGNRIDIARAAAESIRRGLSDQDRIGVVLFSNNIVDYERHSRPDDRDVQRIIERLAPGNSTNVQAGLNLGVELADDVRRDRPNAYNYVILMSDGVANVDATDPFAILRTAEDRDDSNPLRLITIGVGITNYNDVLLEQLAQYGNGWYRYLQDVAQARSTFSRENWLALSIPFADQARAQVRWDDDSVVAWRLVGYENRVTSDRNFEQDRKEFAEIPMGSATTMFFEVELTTDALRDNAVDLGEIELRWLTPLSDESNRQQVAMVSSVSRFGDDTMLDLGSIVALSADRYSWFGQDNLSQDTMALAADNLNELADWFWSLPNDILDTQSGDDFGKLLAAMGAVAEEHESENPGYSR